MKVHWDAPEVFCMQHFQQEFHEHIISSTPDKAQPQQLPKVPSLGHRQKAGSISLLV
jgi:hypothetical protein